MISWAEFWPLVDRGLNLFRFIRQITGEYVHSYETPKTIRARLADEPEQDWTIYCDPTTAVRVYQRGLSTTGLQGRGYEEEEKPVTIDINGMAHVILTVSRFEVAREFYRKLLPEFGMKVVHDGDKLFYCVGARTAIGIEPCDPALAGERFVQQRVGLHHLCLRARSREDVDRCAALLKEMNATIVRGPMEGTWAPGYYYVLFEDPDGIRLEVNFVPGTGLLADGAQFNPATGYVMSFSHGKRVRLVRCPCS